VTCLTEEVLGNKYDRDVSVMAAFCEQVTDLVVIDLVQKVVKYNETRFAQLVAECCR
jgi:hypothetical protein